MENARWNGQALIASEIAKDYPLEKEIRRASGRKELRCPDPECRDAVVRYCHGEKKEAFFAHLNNEHCDYADFDSQSTQVMRLVRRTLYEQLKNKGFRVQPEVKILEHHYTHLLIDMDEENKMAIEIGTQRTTANKVVSLTNAYRDKGIAVKWIVIDNTDTAVQESQTYFLKRYLFNESNNKDLLVISRDGTNIAQYKVDPNRYVYFGRNMTSKNYPETYIERAPVEELTIAGEELTLAGFNERYEDWLLRKRTAFEKKINQQKSYMAQPQAVQEPVMQKPFVYKPAVQRPVECAPSIGEMPNRGDRKCGEKTLALIEQQNDPAYDSMGRRWIKCEHCGRIGTDEIFSSYGGENHVNLGTCYDCAEKKDR